MTENLREYLDEIIDKIIGNKKYKDDIKCELSEHIENLYFDFLSKGYSTERAEQLVINAMGYPQKIAKDFSIITFKKVQRKFTKYATSGIFSLVAVYALSIVISRTLSYKKDYEKYEIFIQGINDGKVSMMDAMPDLLYSSDYKENILLTRAIEYYYEVSEKHCFKKMVVAKNAIGILEEVK